MGVSTLMIHTAGWFNWLMCLFHQPLLFSLDHDFYWIFLFLRTGGICEIGLSFTRQVVKDNLDAKVVLMKIRHGWNLNPSEMELLSVWYVCHFRRGNSLLRQGKMVSPFGNIAFEREMRTRRRIANMYVFLAANNPVY